jgi:hypothetical protein
LNATVLPVTFLCLVVGILFMMFSRKWGSRLLKIGGIWFIVGQILLAVQGAV